MKQGSQHHVFTILPTLRSAHPAEKPISLVDLNILLRPTLPSFNNKYNRPLASSNGAAPFTAVPPLCRLESLADPHGILTDSGWTPLIHPEGDTYFWFQTKGLVTASDVKEPQVRARVEAAHKAIFERLPALDIPARDLTAIEIFISIPPDAASGFVDYYLVDHHTRHPFWVDHVNPATLELPLVDNEASLKSLLTPEYWTHLEYFPQHQAYPQYAEDELIGILEHGSIDDMTSPGSTCPWSAKECQQFLKLVRSFRTSGGFVPIGYRLVCTARLWTTIARTRHINSYGLRNPRLDRNQGLIQYSLLQNRQNLLLSLGEAVCFFLPVQVAKRLTALWNGRVVYQRHWHVFLEDMHKQWFIMGTLCAVVWVAAIVLIALGKSSALVVASASLSAAGVWLSLFLQNAHSRDKIATAPDISAYIMKVEDYYHGLRPLSIVFCFPHALTIYSVLLLQTALVYQSLEQTKDSLALSALVMSAWTVPLALASIMFTMFGGAKWT
ncbi:hypothetical protein FRB99_005622 [Tulasnella sp. 403]|nr:hypothetical protein FRB99_005622 [Tulasnella sp. 403]